MNKALKALKEIEWMDVDGQRDELCPVCGRPHHMQHAQWCQLGRAIGFLEREPKCKTCSGHGIRFKKFSDTEYEPCPDCAEQPPESRPEAKRPATHLVIPPKLPRATRQAWDKMDKAIEAGEFTKKMRTKVQQWKQDYRKIFNYDIELIPIKELLEACDMLDRLERENKEKMDIIAKGFNEAAETLLEPLKIQLATKDENMANLQEQLIKMCRVFHSIDCVCKWCNIAKERAVAGT